MDYVTLSGNLYGNLCGNLILTGNNKFPFPISDDHNTWCVKDTFETAMFYSFNLNLAMVKIGV